MTAFLWTHFALGCLGLLCNAIMAGSGRTIEYTTKDFVARLVIGCIFLVWTGVLLFGGAS